MQIQSTANTSKETKGKGLTVLGIDYGRSNIGLAFGKNGLVSPLKIISGRDPVTAIHEIVRFTLENKVDRIVLGLPLTADGKETKTSIEVRNFAKLLKIYSKKPVEFYTEHETSIEAVKQAIDMGIPNKKRHNNDHLSAAIILRRYFASLT